MVASSQSPSTTEQLLAGLSDVETIRKKIRLNYSIIGTVLLIGLIIEAVTWMSIAVGVIILFVLVYTNWYGIPVSIFENSFISTITKNTVKLLHPGLQIDYQSHLKLSEIATIQTLPAAPDYFSGKNLIYGNIEGNNMRISEIFAHWKNKNHIKYDAKHVFNALIISSQNMHYPSGELFLSTQPELLPQVGTAQQEYVQGEAGNSCYYMTTQDNTEMKQVAEKMAVVINTYYQLYHKPISMTIAEGTMTLAIMNPEGFSYFNPSIFKSVMDKKAMETYYTDLRFLFDSATGIA